ncbi:hypothetical protein Dxin01_03970 [Deinococcus xinjiangensis]|uniref:DUF1524 domain-containing protein n=1 Tax=Deinococcus xinjiangensis TaxID=457454 RepID=A0ABP9VHT9_9DEIO
MSKEYKRQRIRIAFHPLEEKFEVSNTAIQKDPAWIQDIAVIFEAGARTSKVRRDYLEANPQADSDAVEDTLEKLKSITTNQVGIIELSSALDIETVTEIFIRVNSEGVALSQADFVMSKIAANETYGGNTLRKAIDYFSHLAKHPAFLTTVEQDTAFAASEFYPKLKWLGGINDDLYDPSYTDMLRVAFTSEFGRGRLQDLVALLSGRNFETKQYEEAIAEESFAKLRKGIHNFISQQHFEKFTMIIRSAGFITPDLISSQNAVNFAYIIYLHGRSKGVNQAELEGLVRRWFAFALLTGRYSGSAETTIDRDIHQINERGLAAYVQEMTAATLTPSFWDNLLPQQMDTSNSNSPYFSAFQAAQVKAGDPGFLSQAIKVPDLLLNRTDVHHIYPADFLKKQGLTKGKYNQIANFALTQQEINIAIGNKDPKVYFAELREQVSGGPVKYGGITDAAQMRENLRRHCIPAVMLDNPTMPYEAFLEQRRKLMAHKLRDWFGGL